MRVLVAADSFVPMGYFQTAFALLEAEHQIEYFQVEAGRIFLPSTPSERRISEYQGSPEELVEYMAGVEILVVHGAPVTDSVVDASPLLKLVCCARSGPVNIDVDALGRRGIPLVLAPGKNAEAVADQTLALLIMLARRFPAAQRFLEDGGRLSGNFVGQNFLGHDLRGHNLGLVGLGNVGRRVALRAVAFGMSVLGFDPYVGSVPNNGFERVDSLDDLLQRSEFISLHARASSENENLFDAAAFSRMLPGAYFVNTARETLVDEGALDGALASGHLAGAALDVMRAYNGPGRHPLLRHENVILTPHIGGATHETLMQGSEMVAAEVARFAAGEPLVNVHSHSAATT